MSLNVQGLYKTFGEKIAVDHIGFKMEKPGIFGLLGTNGAGKTTTIRMILGIMNPDSGSATWNGRPITREHLRFGYMPEERGIYMKNTVIEQLVYFGMLWGMSKADAKSSAISLMGQLEVLEYKDMTTEKLSKGNQQKIQMIATIIHNPTLIFLDEPFSGLDPMNAEVLRRFLRKLVEDGKYIVMSSHQMATVEEFCENLLILSQGKTVLQGNLSAIKASYGHTNLIVRCNENIASFALETGLTLVEKRAGETEYQFAEPQMPNIFLARLIDNQIFPIKFEVKEPSLQQIFIEKVGENR